MSHHVVPGFEKEYDKPLSIQGVSKIHFSNLLPKISYYPPCLSSTLREASHFLLMSFVLVREDVSWLTSYWIEQSTKFVTSVKASGSCNAEERSREPTPLPASCRKVRD